jgi:hypothetical protein
MPWHLPPRLIPPWHFTTRVGSIDDAEAPKSDDEVFNPEEALTALRSLSGDDNLENLVTAENPIGYNVFKNVA